MASTRASVHAAPLALLTPSASPSTTSSTNDSCTNGGRGGVGCSHNLGGRCREFQWPVASPVRRSPPSIFLASSPKGERRDSTTPNRRNSPTAADLTPFAPSSPCPVDCPTTSSGGNSTSAINMNGGSSSSNDSNSSNKPPCAPLVRRHTTAVVCSPSESQTPRDGAPRVCRTPELDVAPSAAADMPTSTTCFRPASSGSGDSAFGRCSSSSGRDWRGRVGSGDEGECIAGGSGGYSTRVQDGRGGSSSSGGIGRSRNTCNLPSPTSRPNELPVDADASSEVIAMPMAMPMSMWAHSLCLPLNMETDTLALTTVWQETSGAKGKEAAASAATAATAALKSPPVRARASPQGMSKSPTSTGGKGAWRVGNNQGKEYCNVGQGSSGGNVDGSIRGNMRLSDNAARSGSSSVATSGGDIVGMNGGGRGNSSSDRGSGSGGGPRPFGAMASAGNTTSQRRRTGCNIDLSLDISACQFFVDETQDGGEEDESSVQGDNSGEKMSDFSVSDSEWWLEEVENHNVGGGMVCSGVGGLASSILTAPSYRSRSSIRRGSSSSSGGGNGGGFKGAVIVMSASSEALLPSHNFSGSAGGDNGSSSRGGGGNVVGGSWSSGRPVVLKRANSMRESRGSTWQRLQVTPRSVISPWSNNALPLAQMGLAMEGLAPTAAAIPPSTPPPPSLEAGEAAEVAAAAGAATAAPPPTGYTRLEDVVGGKPGEVALGAPQSVGPECLQISGERSRTKGDPRDAVENGDGVASRSLEEGRALKHGTGCGSSSSSSSSGAGRQTRNSNSASNRHRRTLSVDVGFLHQQEQERTWDDVDLTLASLKIEEAWKAQGDVHVQMVPKLGERIPPLQSSMGRGASIRSSSRQLTRKMRSLVERCKMLTSPRRKDPSPTSVTNAFKDAKGSRLPWQ